MRLELKLHPDFTCRAVERIDVEIKTGGALIGFRYVLTGDVGALAIPARADMKRADELWRHTCFEVFVHKPGAAGYLEFNFSPSMQWAAYQFDDYRAGMRNAGVEPQNLNVAVGERVFMLEAWLPRDAVESARLGLSAVIEAADGAKSYWALAHPPGKPDFHHADSFAYELKP